jgi:uncharacterized protein (DUF58 family)
MRNAAAVASRNGSAPGLERVLYRLYHLGTGMNAFVARRLRPAGIAVCLLFVFASFLGIGQPQDSVYFLFSMAFILLVSGLCWVFFRWASLRAWRELPRHATAGETIHYPLRIEHAGRRRLRQVWFCETAGDPRPGVEEFLQLREPGEEERNAFDRRLAYYRWQWLISRRRLFDGGVSGAPLDIPAGGRVTCRIPLTPLRRGVIRLDDLRVLLPDPLGLFQRCVKVRNEPLTLTVLPRRHALPALELPGGASYRIGSDSAGNEIGNDGEFLGLREYRPGDPLRQIHWKSWARTGRPITKELEDTFYPRYGLVLDTRAAGDADPAFEEMVSVAASFVATLDSGDSLLDLMFVKQEAHKVTAGRGVGRVEKLLEVLAGVTPDPEPDLEALARLVLAHREDLTSCLVLLHGWDAARADFLRKLSRGGVVCSPILLGNGPKPPEAPAPWIDSEHVARDLQTLPRRLPVYSA